MSDLYKLRVYYGGEWTEMLVNPDTIAYVREDRHGYAAKWRYSFTGGPNIEFESDQPPNTLGMRPL